MRCCAVLCGAALRCAALLSSASTASHAVNLAVGTVAFLWRTAFLTDRADGILFWDYAPATQLFFIRSLLAGCISYLVIGTCIQFSISPLLRPRLLHQDGSDETARGARAFLWH